jgi:hypothetical protein
MHFADAFKKPCRFEPSVVVDIGPEFDRLIDMLNCHVSQFYEWLPFNGGVLDQVPREDAARRAWLSERFRRRIRPLANQYRSLVEQIYGPEVGAGVEWIEAFEVSEYGAPLDAAALARLFPFLPRQARSHSRFTRKEWADTPEED